MSLANMLGISESNFFVRSGVVPELSAKGILAPGYMVPGNLLEDIKKPFEPPKMPEVDPLPEAPAPPSAGEKTEGMKSTILTSMDQTLMGPAQTQKAELMG